MTILFTPLDELNHQQIDKVLAKFQLISRKETEEEKIEVIKCIESYDLKFSRYEDSDVLVGFNKANNFHDIKSRDDSVRLFKDISPCNTCGKCVDDNHVGLRCSDCMHFFHNKCTSSPVGKDTFKYLINTPDWVRVLCPKCVASTQRSEESLNEIKENMVKVNLKLEATQKSYASASNKNINSNLRKANEFVETLARQNNVQNNEESKEKSERTRIVRKPTDPRIKDSTDIRKEFDKTFPDLYLSNTRFTAGGSIVLEFEELAGAATIDNSWSKTLFGGNAGIEKFGAQNSTGIVKYVYNLRESDAEIEANIKSNYPNAPFELFKKDGKFTGMIKIKFRDENELKQVIDNKFTIFERKFTVEPFKQKPKVIKCNTCQKFGHISRLCRSNNNPICGKCSEPGHESKDCNIPEEDYKCFHCHQNHITGSYKCGVVKEKLEDIISRQSRYGY